MTTVRFGTPPQLALSASSLPRLALQLRPLSLPRQYPPIALALRASASKFLSRRAACRALAPIVGADGTYKHPSASRALAIHRARTICSVRDVEIPVCCMASNATCNGLCSLLRCHLTL